MGLTAIVSDTLAEGFSSQSLIGSLFVSVALIFLLGYLDLYNSTEVTDEQHRKALVAAILPLVVVFAALVLFQAIAIINSS